MDFIANEKIIQIIPAPAGLKYAALGNGTIKATDWQPVFCLCLMETENDNIVLPMRYDLSEGIAPIDFEHILDF